MKRKIHFIIVIVVVILSSWVGIFLWKNLRGSTPAFFAPKEKITDLIPSSAENSNSTTDNPESGLNVTGLPLKLPEGFKISIFAENLSGARVMIFDSFGNMWISRPSEDVVTQLEIQGGKVVRQNDILVGLNNPHGLALDPDQPSLLYIGEEDKITKITLYSDGNYEKIADLPSGGGHSTRTLLFGPDKKLYVSSGSSCNVCVEKDARRAAIYSLNRDGSDFKKFSDGLRNSVFMTINPRTNEIWATEMGRDLLGDNTPPDEINIISEGKNYGWPYCYGKKIHDSNFDSSGTKVEFCQTTQSSQIDVPAHSAPLGLDFLENPKLPSKYENDLLVSYHGSWNRSVPTGYKVVRHKFDQQGNYEGVEDFITGWLTGGSALGRPVDILEVDDGRIFISDDKAGVVYLVEYVGE